MQPSPIDPNYTDQLVFEGLSVDLHDASGKTIQGSMDATLAAKQAALNTMEYLCNLGYTAEQVHLLLSAAVRLQTYSSLLICYKILPEWEY